MRSVYLRSLVHVINSSSDKPKIEIERFGMEYKYLDGSSEDVRNRMVPADVYDKVKLAMTGGATLQAAYNIETYLRACCLSGNFHVRVEAMLRKAARTRDWSKVKELAE